MTSALALRTAAARPHDTGTAPEGRGTDLRTRPLVRLVAVPDLEPPFDDEPADRPWYGTVPYTRDHEPAAPPGYDHEPAAPSHDREPAPPGHDHEPARAMSRVGPAGRPGGETPAATSEATAATQRYLALCVEVLGGFRPLGHLRVLTSETAYEQVNAELVRPRPTRRPPGRLPPRPRGAGLPGQAAPPANQPTGAGLLRAGARYITPPGGHIRLRRWRVCEPCEGVAEVAAVLGRAGQAWALALRMERRRGTWLCTHLEVL